MLSEVNNLASDGLAKGCKKKRSDFLECQHFSSQKDSDI